jgi:hypothetical protein
MALPASLWYHQTAKTRRPIRKRFHWLQGKEKHMKRILTSATFTILWASIYLLTANFTTAQTNRSGHAPDTKESDAPASLTCPASQFFISGAGLNKFGFCVTQNGNIRRVESPAAFTQLPRNEGYVVCNNQGTVALSAGDEMDVDDLFWGPPVVTQPGGPNTLPLQIRRNTEDGKMQLRQTFEQDTEKREIIVTMILVNISGAPLTNVRLSRYFDGDLSNDAGDDRYDKSADSVWGRDNGAGPGHHGLLLTTLSLAQPHVPAVELFSDWNPYIEGTAQDCTPINQATPTPPGNYIGRITFNLGTMNAGVAKTIKVLYKRF